jgi:chitin synthase
MSQYSDLPHLPFMPFGGGPGSVAGSDYGAHNSMPMPSIGYQNTGAFRMMPGDPGNTMMTNMYGGGSGSQIEVRHRYWELHNGPCRLSLWQSVHGFEHESNPMDEDLINALRNLTLNLHYGYDFHILHLLIALNVL